MLKLIEQFVDTVYRNDVVIDKIQEVDQLNRKQLLDQQKSNYKKFILLTVTHSRALPNLRDILTKNWHILQVNQSSGKTSSTLPIIVFKNDTSLKHIIGTNPIHNN